eukprot:scaffold45550_cov61-Phaeocystis_antarctica.AAC.1
MRSAAGTPPSSSSARAAAVSPSPSASDEVQRLRTAVACLHASGLHSCAVRAARAGVTSWRRKRARTISPVSIPCGSLGRDACSTRHAACCARVPCAARRRTSRGWGGTARPTCYTSSLQNRLAHRIIYLPAAVSLRQPARRNGYNKHDTGWARARHPKTTLPHRPPGPLAADRTVGGHPRAPARSGGG